MMKLYNEEYMEKDKEEDKKVRIINLTAHNVTMLDDNNDIRKVFKPSGHVARLCQSYDAYGYIKELDIDIEVYKPINILDFDNIEIEPYTVYIVSWLFLQELTRQNHPKLNQFVAPNTIDMPKDRNGYVKGVKRFMVLN